MVIFFDIDETLINQKRAEAAAVAQLLAANGDLLERRCSAAEFCRLWRALREKHAPAFLAGKVSIAEQRRRRMRELFAIYGRPLSAREADRLIEFYEAHYRASWTLFDDVLPSLQSLYGYRCGIISNGSSRQQKLKIQKTGIADFFDIIVVSEDVGVAKPHRDIFLTACRRAGTCPQHCCYIGDRLDQDALASRAAGMHSFWLCRERNRSDLRIDCLGSLNDLACSLEGRLAV